MRLRAQTALEYVFITGAGILFIVLVIIIIRSGVISSGTGQVKNGTDVFQNLTGTCNYSLPENQSRACGGGGAQNRTCVAPGLWSPWGACG